MKNFIWSLLSVIICVQIAIGPLCYGQNSEPPVEQFKAHFQNWKAAAAGGGDRYALDLYRLLDQTAVTGNETLLAKDLWISFNPDTHAPPEGTEVRVKDGARLIELQEPKPFSIHAHGKLLYRFHIPVHAVGIFENYLFFIEDKELKNGKAEISFVDLDTFSPAIGKTKLPVFRARISLDTAISSVKITSEGLLLNDFPMNSHVFGLFSDLNEVAFNITVNLTDPETIETNTALIAEFTNYFKQSLTLFGKMQGDQIAASQAAMSDFENFAQQMTEFMRTKVGITATKAKDGHVLPTLKDQLGEAVVNRSMKSIGEQVKMQRKLSARLHLMFAQLTLPRPMGAPKLEAAMGMAASGLWANINSEPQGAPLLRESFLQLLNYRPLQYLVGTTGVALTAWQYPVEFGLFIYSMFTCAHGVVNGLLDRASDTFSLLGEAARKSFAWLNPSRIYEAYFTAEKLPKLFVGAGAAFSTLMVALFVPHVLVNLYKLIQDFRHDNPQYQGNIREWFIARQNQEATSFRNNLAAGYAKETGAAPVNFTDEDTAEVRRINAEMDAGNGSRWYSSWITELKALPLFKPKTQQITGAGGTQAPDITSTLGAMRHFLISWASFTTSQIAFMKTWTAWFAFRSFIWFPKLAMTFLMYPDYFGTITTETPMVTIPTKLNGGKRSLIEKIGMRIKAKDYLKALRAWENKLIPIEQMVQQQVMKKAYAALVQFIDNHKDLKDLYSMGGISRLTDKRTAKLAAQNRTFFRAYFDRLFSGTIQAVLARAVEGDSEITDQESLTSEQLKDIAVRNAIDINVSPEEVGAMVERVATEQNIFEAARSLAQDEGRGFERYALNSNYQTVTDLDPANNRQVDRIRSVQRQMKKPQAVARAVRSAIASMFVDKVMKLGFMFLFMAGIDDPLLSPLQPEKFSDTSWFYLSKYTLLTGFLSGAVVSMLAEAWMKLQMDEMHDGQFNKVPVGEDAKRGLVSLWWKKAFRDPENSFMKNYKHYTMKMVIPNLRAALAITLAIDLLTLGRFDLDVYLIGYFFCFFTPFSALDMKMDQAFDLAASGYYTNKYPERLRGHPEAQEKIGNKVGKARLVYNWFNKIYESVVAYTTGNFSMMTVPEIGPRSFARILFFGYTPIELAYSGLEKAKNLLGFIPGATGIIHACEALLTNNYEAWHAVPRPTK